MNRTHRSRSILTGYAVLLRVHLSRGELDAACSALQEVEDVGRTMEPALYLQMCSYFTTIDQVRLWLACRELDRAMDWAELVEREERHSTPYVHERGKVARARIFLAKDQPVLALQQLEPALQRATEGQHWGHVIEIRLLQALAYQMLQEETQALSALSEAVRLGEPEGYIRRGARHFFASSHQRRPRGGMLTSGRNRIAVPTHGDKSCART